MANPDDPPKKHGAKRKFSDFRFPPRVSGNPSGGNRSRKAQKPVTVTTSGHDQAALDAFRRLITQRDGSKVPTIAQIFTALTLESLERDPDQKKTKRNSFNVPAMKLAIAEAESQSVALSQEMSRKSGNS